jgi:hypothetical protein
MRNADEWVNSEWNPSYSIVVEFQKRAKKKISKFFNLAMLNRTHRNLPSLDNFSSFTTARA